MVTVEAKDLSAGILHVLQNSGEWINLQKTPKCDFLFSQHPEPPNCTGDYNDSHHSSIEKRAEIEILLKHHTDIESVKAFFFQVIYAHAQSHHKVSLRDLGILSY